MKSFSAQYIFTNSGTPLMRGIISTDEEGRILGVEDTAGNLSERHSVAFYNGIIIPAFVNCHCHLELSHMKGVISSGTGLSSFIMEIRNTRDTFREDIQSAIRSADSEMYDEGIALCADICNTPDTFNIKKESRIKYLNLLEVFGINPSGAGKRIAEISKTAEISREMDLPWSIVPHSAYSLSLPLMRKVKEITENNSVTSIHFMETPPEREFIESQSGDLMTSYLATGIITSAVETVKSHIEAILKEVTLSGNLILVHNTFADRDIVKAVSKRGKTFWCLCPGSNIYIENSLPPVNMLLEENCTLVFGTDSLASNSGLSILEEMKTIQKYFPEIPITEIVRWATLNGSEALNEDTFGAIEPGKKPGLLLLEDLDLENMKLLPETRVRRLI
jgi:cytosine/adenosine deaminase-related metal-dependent hydrolase